MQSPTLEAPAVHVVHGAHPPAPARVGLTYHSAWYRGFLAAAAPRPAAAAAGASAALPFRYLWPPVALALGAWGACYLWNGHFRVRSFVGLCPACGRHLRLPTGTRLRLPYTVVCRGCGAGCELRVRDADPAGQAAASLRHFLPDCAGEWRSQWLWDEGYVACTHCGARHVATTEMRRLAAAENQRGDLLARLAEEGRYLL